MINFIGGKMSEFTFALIGTLSLAIWLIIGRKILKDPTTNPHKFALWMSGWLGVTELVLAFLIGGWGIQSNILGMILLIGTIIIGYPIAYFSFRLLKKQLNHPGGERL